MWLLSVVITPACSPASQAELSGWSIPSVPGAVVEFTNVTYVWFLKCMHMGLILLGDIRGVCC